MKLFADMERKRRELAERDQEERKRKREAEIEEEENQKAQKEWQKNFEVRSFSHSFWMFNGHLTVFLGISSKSSGKLAIVSSKFKIKEP